MLYLDYSASAPLRPEALAAMQTWLHVPGNPASAHSMGRKVRQALEDAREQLAALLGAFPDEVVFTSGATEANNLALFGLAGDAPGTVLASPIEHPCVVEPLKQLAARGFNVTYLPVSEDGVVSTTSARAPGERRLITLMLANHETGALQPVADLVDGRTPVHTDAAQAAGKIPVDFHKLGVTSLSLSAHKFGGPVGIGALLVSRCAHLRPLFFGGHQQRGRRPGTEPVALAVGMAAALAAAMRNWQETQREMQSYRMRFLECLSINVAPVLLNGPFGGLPHILNLSFPGCRADALLAALDLAGVACATGSACSSGSLLPSPVLQAMGITGARLQSALRFSFGPSLTTADIDEAACIVARVVQRVRAVQTDEPTDPALA